MPALVARPYFVGSITLVAECPSRCVPVIKPFRLITNMSVSDSRSTYYIRSELARNRSSPARLRGGWGLAGAGAGVP